MFIVGFELPSVQRRMSQQVNVRTKEILAQDVTGHLLCGYGGGVECHAARRNIGVQI